MNVHYAMPPHNHEFEKPICFVSENISIQFSCGQVEMHGMRFAEEIKKTLDAVLKRHDEIAKTLTIQVETHIKEIGKWPADWQQGDHLHISNGVIFHARCRGLMR